MKATNPLWAVVLFPKLTTDHYPRPYSVAFVEGPMPSSKNWRRPECFPRTDFVATLHNR